MTDILSGQLWLAGEDALMGATRRKYTPQYRRDAAHLVIDSGRAISAVAAEIGVGEQLLGRWVARERARMDSPPPALDINERAELERLRAENTQLRMDREFLKKSSGLLRGGERVEPDAAFAVIHAEKASRAESVLAGLSVLDMCELLQVSRSGYYDWASRLSAEPGPRAQRRADLAGKVMAAHQDSDGVYGAPRITAELREQGEVVSVKTVAKVMRANGITSAVTKRASLAALLSLAWVPAPLALSRLPWRLLSRAGGQPQEWLRVA